MTRDSLRLGTALLIILAVCGCAGGSSESACKLRGLVFCTGFEEPDLSRWDSPRDTIYTSSEERTFLLRHPGPFGVDDNRVLRIRVPPGRGATELVRLLPGRHAVLFARWYQQWEPGYDFTARNHGSGFHAGHREHYGKAGYRPTGEAWFRVWLEPVKGRLNIYAYYPGMYQDCWDDAGHCWGDSFPCFLDDGYYCSDPRHREIRMPPRLEAGRWYCLELMVDAGDPVPSPERANGSLNFWIDGVAYGPWIDLWFRTTPNLTLSLFALGLFHHEAHSAEGILVDDVAVSTQRIGCELPSG